MPVLPEIRGQPGYAEPPHLFYERSHQEDAPNLTYLQNLKPWKLSDLFLLTLVLISGLLVLQARRGTLVLAIKPGFLWMKLRLNKKKRVYIVSTLFSYILNDKLPDRVFFKDFVGAHQDVNILSPLICVRIFNVTLCQFSLEVIQ